MNLTTNNAKLLHKALNERIHMKGRLGLPIEGDDADLALIQAKIHNEYLKENSDLFLDKIPSLDFLIEHEYGPTIYMICDNGDKFELLIDVPALPINGDEPYFSLVTVIEVSSNCGSDEDWEEDHPGMNYEQLLCMWANLK